MTNRQWLLAVGCWLLFLCAACGSCDRVGPAAGPAPSFGPLEGVPIIRVALKRNAESVPVGVNGPYTMEDGENGKVLSQGLRLARTEVAFESARFAALTRVKTHHIVIKPRNDGAILVGANRYRGTLHLWGKGGTFTLVNHVNLEHYLASVIPCEMDIGWNEAALQAQAVAARTYALWRMQRPGVKKRSWDLTSGADSQVYGGFKKESDKSRKVIVDTAGMVLVFADLDDDEAKIFPAYYHSTCGGHTADAHEVFGGEELPCLTGVICTGCRDSPVYEWTFTLDQDELREVLRKIGGKDLGKIAQIECIAPEDSDWVRAVVLKGEKGECRLSVGKFRRAVGTGRMKSANVTVQKRGDWFKLVGYGWGHGVGMCQWGAAGMAHPDLDFKADEILKHYYQGAQIRRIY